MLSLMRYLTGKQTWLANLDIIDVFLSIHLLERIFLRSVKDDVLQSLKPFSTGQSTTARMFTVIGSNLWLHQVFVMGKVVKSKTSC